MTTRFLTTCGVVLVTLLLLSGPAQAVVMGTCAPDLPGGCTKALTLLTPTSLQIQLTNTGLGFITADAFDLPGAVSASLFSTTNANFALFAPVGGVNVQPFGSREFVLGFNANWQGSGNPSGGIPGGGSATFVLTLSASTGLTENQLFAAMNEAIRVRGAPETIGQQDDLGSDKDLVTTNGVVPEPATLLLVGGGLVGLAHLARRRKQH